VAPITAAPASQAGAAQTAGAAAGGSARKDGTINYELDRSIRHVQQGAGGVKRLSVAVVVNYRNVLDAKGKRTAQALSATELAQVNNLVKEAMGFSAERGDSLNVVNSAFASDAVEPVELPVWKQPENIALARTVAPYVLMVMLALFVWFGILRPLLRKHLYPPAPADAGKEGAPALIGSEEDAQAQAQLLAQAQAEALARQERRHTENLEYAQATSVKNPRMVAMLIKQWMAEEAGQDDK
jgi:flagellar M-ring protein FliF